MRASLVALLGLSIAVSAVQAAEPKRPDAAGGQDAVKASIEKCDRLAALPFDADRPSSIAGIDEEDMNAKKVIAACRAAVAAAGSATGPQAAIDLRRTQFELGRGLNASNAFAEGRGWYEKAAEGGSVAAMYSLAQSYAGGLGVDQNVAEARKWLEKAAAAGSADAMLRLAESYAYPSEGTANPETARGWYEKAAATGDPGAMYNIGLLYEAGDVFAKDEAAARSWYEKAAAAGHAEAKAKLASPNKARR